jgi:hypothetical protein
MSLGLHVFLNPVTKHGFLNAFLECHVPTTSARSTCIKTITTVDIGWLLINKYSISTNRWHQMSQADIQRTKKNYFQAKYFCCLKIISGKLLQGFPCTPNSFRRNYCRGFCVPPIHFGETIAGFSVYPQFISAKLLQGFLCTPIHFGETIAGFSVYPQFISGKLLQGFLCTPNSFRGNYCRGFCVPPIHFGEITAGVSVYPQFISGKLLQGFLCIHNSFQGNYCMGFCISPIHFGETIAGVSVYPQATLAFVQLEGLWRGSAFKGLKESVTERPV